MPSPADEHSMFGRHDGKNQGSPQLHVLQKGLVFRARFQQPVKDERSSVKRKGLPSLICGVGLEGDGFCPQRTLPMSGNVFGRHVWEDAVGIEWVETRDVAKHPTTHSAALPIPHFSGAKIEKPYLTGYCISPIDQMSKLRLRRHDFKCMFIPLHPYKVPILKGLGEDAGS